MVSSGDVFDDSLLNLPLDPSFLGLPRDLFAWDEVRAADASGAAVATAPRATLRAPGSFFGQAFGQPSAPAQHKNTDASGVSAAEAAALLPPIPASRGQAAATPSRSASVGMGSS